MGLTSNPIFSTKGVRAAVQRVIHRGDHFVDRDDAVTAGVHRQADVDGGDAEGDIYAEDYLIDGAASVLIAVTGAGRESGRRWGPRLRGWHGGLRCRRT